MSRAETRTPESRARQRAAHACRARLAIARFRAYISTIDLAGQLGRFAALARTFQPLSPRSTNRTWTRNFVRRFPLHTVTKRIISCIRHLKFYNDQKGFVSSSRTTARRRFRPCHPLSAPASTAARGPEVAFDPRTIRAAARSSARSKSPRARSRKLQLFDDHAQNLKP